MKILFVSQRAHSFGREERALSHLRRMLRIHGHLVEDYIEDRPRWKTIIPSFRTYRDLLRAAEHLKPDIVHIHQASGIFLATLHVALRGRIPIVQTISNSSGILKGSFLSHIARFWTSRLEGLLTSSETLKNKLRHAGYLTIPIDVLPTPAEERSIESPRSLLPLFVFVGELVKTHGLPVILQAAKEVPQAQFILIGDGPWRAFIENRIALGHQPNVSIMTAVPLNDLLRLIQRSWGVLLPAPDYEILPQVALEAWSVGTPVIASDWGALQEEIQVGQNGWVFPAGDAPALWGILQQLIRTPPNWSMVNGASRKTLRDRHTISVLYPALLEFYVKIINGFRQRKGLPAHREQQLNTADVP